MKNKLKKNDVIVLKCACCTGTIAIVNKLCKDGFVEFLKSENDFEFERFCIIYLDNVEKIGVL